MKRAGYPIQSSDTSANGEMENIRSLFRPTFYEAGDASLIFEETGRRRGGVAERLGRKKPNTDMQCGDGVSVRRGLAERLGTFGDDEEPFLPPNKAPEQIRIKTLEEIRQEKAAKSQSQSQKENPSDMALKVNRPKTSKGVKRAITVRDGSVSNVKTFSEVLRAKKKRQEEQDTDSKKSRGESDPATPDPEAANVGQLRVKTLEEIRMEKAAKIQTQQTVGAETKKSSGTEENGAKKPRLLRIKELDSRTGNVTTEKSAEVTEKPTRVATSNGVKVKTFEEIMREKRLRKQEMEEQAKDSAEAEPAQKHTDVGTLKRKAPAKISVTSPSASSPSSTTEAPDSTLSTQKLPVGKPILLKSKAASPLYSTTPRARGAAVKAATAVLVKQSSPPPEAESDSQSPSRSREVPDKNTRSSPALSPAKQDRVAAKALTSDKTQNNNPKKSPEHIADTTKVRPKLNVKPSVMKPAVQVKPGQKRRGAERSAVAAVKPLSSTSTVPDEPQQETACRDRQEIPSPNAEAQLSSAVPRSPSTLLDSGSGCSPLREDLQTVPVFKQSLSQDPKQTSNVAAASEACTVPQSPLLKTQTKSRRLSMAATRTASTSSATASNSAMDDFEELINEFTEDHLEEDVDPGIGEDDLLQELSEMIDS
ncbi:Zinc finger CCCH domain-containing protein 11A [Liparis tanakae]|uniref:Zinc finger CCCH domain-containing protein 11A n=1 Tax=Liparis tanakae TaxID=230148 RepID=A0A4Z2JDA8_9TELE|nr:Zinc finger CCCH domain-containing protein 11A [Liparis tanakae]